MAATQPLAASNINQSSAATAALAFAFLCNGHPVLNSTMRCPTVQQAIAGAVNLAKRPALLCSSLQLCSSSLSSSCLVDIPSGSSGAAAVQVAAPSLDNCTVEGLPEGGLVPGGVRTLTPLPTGETKLPSGIQYFT
jgi:hypothetical protein